MNSKINYFKTILLVVISSTLLSCSNKNKNAPTGFSNRTDHSNTPTPQGMNSSSQDLSSGDEGGGLDSSGGDPIKSTEKDVREILKEKHLKKNLRKMILRLAINLSNTPKINFEEEFGEGSYKLFDHFLYSKKSQSKNLSEVIQLDKFLSNIRFDLRSNEDCIATNGHKASSAKGNINIGEICVNISKLKVFEGEKLRIQTYALMIHELVHLVGLDEEYAAGIQNILVKNPGLFYLSKPLEEDLLQLPEKYMMYMSNLTTLIKNGDQDNFICLELGGLESLNNQYIKVFTSSKDKKRKAKVNLPHSRLNNFFIANEIIRHAQGFCGLRYSKIKYFVVEKGDRISLMTNYMSWLGTLVNFGSFIKMWVNPDKPSKHFFLNSRDGKQLLLNYELKEGHKAFNVKERFLEENLDANEVGCIMGTFDRQTKKLLINEPEGKFAFRVSDHEFYQQELGTLYSPDIFENGQRPILFTKIKDQRGLQFSLLYNELQTIPVFNDGAGLITVDHGKIIPISILVPGVMESFQLSFQYTSKKPERYFQVLKCQIMRDDIDEQSIKFDEPSLIQESKLNFSSRLEEYKDHFMKKFKNLNNELILSGTGKDGRVEELGNSRITQLTYNGNIIVETENEDIQCILPTKNFQNLKNTAQQMLKKDFTLYCTKDGLVLGQQSEWALDMKVEFGD